MHHAGVQNVSQHNTRGNYGWNGQVWNPHTPGTNGNYQAHTPHTPQYSSRTNVQRVTSYAPAHPQPTPYYHGPVNYPQNSGGVPHGYHTYHGNSNLYPNPKVYGVHFYEKGGVDKGGPYAMYAELSTEDLASPSDEVQPCHCTGCKCPDCDG